jgi:hypothetical protein
VVVVFDQRSADAYSQRAEPRWIELDVVADVGGVNDPRESNEREVVTESVLDNQGLERVPRTRGVERVTPICSVATSTWSFTARRTPLQHQ